MKYTAVTGWRNDVQCEVMVISRYQKPGCHSRLGKEGKPPGSENTPSYLFTHTLRSRLKFNLTRLSTTLDDGSHKALGEINETTESFAV